ncbi:heavy metal translocating P-type ATPase [Paenibacillus caui]|uniref:heavy metal translocating P-type ATPase n=1 Tax=Paenibacillus caui TaxID=2873927 RepID=UPI001CA86D03|nr:heavy metal translocating P-type ATPase [Paenibacillus caui]
MIDRTSSSLTRPDESGQVEYKVEGLSCPNCARQLQEELRRLPGGQNAALHYNSGRLLISPHADFGHIQRILKSDGAVAFPLEGTHPGEAAALPSGAAGMAGSAGHAASHKHGHGHAHEPAHPMHPMQPMQHHAEDLHPGHEHTHDHRHSDGHGADVGRLGKYVLSVSALLYAAALLAGSALPPFALVALFLTAIILSGYSTFSRGLRNLLKLRFNMDTLMTVALVGAVCIGEWKEATLVAILFGLNELLEGYGMEKARKSMESLLEAAPQQALLLRGEETVTVPAAELRAGDLVLVRPGEKIPSDGMIREGRSSVNEAAITGESVPAAKQPGDAVFGGSVNSDGVLRIEITKAYEDSSLSKIMKLVREAQDTKTPTELFIDKFAKYYTPAIMAIALLVFLIPPLLFGQPWMKWLYEGLAILIVGCPCSLVLSSPIALVSGMARSARIGVLVKGGVHLEQLAKVDAIAFDKTGTLTEGQPAVIEEIIYDDGRFYKVAAAIEQSSLHPLALAIVGHIKAKAGQEMGARAEEVTTLPGLGIRARVDGTLYWLGSEEVLRHAFPGGEMDGKDRKALERMKQDGLTVVLVADSQRVLGLFGLADRIRPETRGALQQLHAAGIAHTVMLTGDHEGTARAIAGQAGVTDWYAGLLPEQKVLRVRELAQRWNAAMVGDGINDAPALAAAGLGIAMGKGTDSAIETADVVLMQDHLGKLPAAIRIARRASAVIRWNIGISIGLKLIALLLTIPGLLTLWIAVLSDMGATIIVTVLGLTVLLGKNKEMGKISN